MSAAAKLVVAALAVKATDQALVTGASTNTHPVLGHSSALTSMGKQQLTGLAFPSP